MARTSTKKKITKAQKTSIVENEETAQATEPVATKSKPAKMSQPGKFDVSIFQGGDKIVVNVGREVARKIIRAVEKRNLSAFPMTVIDNNGIAHTLRNVERASYTSDLLEANNNSVIN